MVLKTNMIQRMRRITLPGWLRDSLASLSAVGLIVAILFFAASLTPSLVPRTTLMQGVLSGVAMGIGYALGAFGFWLWHYLELPEPRVRFQRLVMRVAIVICMVAVVSFLWRAGEWQNSIRVLMDMELLGGPDLGLLGLVSLGVFTLLLALGRVFHLVFRAVSGWTGQHIPRRIANVTGLVVAALLFWTVIEGVLFSQALRLADASFQQLDALLDAEMAPPADERQTGSDASLISWEALGRAGRNYVVSGPSVAELEAFLDEPAQKPLRVYVGLNSAESIEARAELALAELQRAGGFERAVLVIATPTGTGWLDPAAMDTLEYLQRGDVATVAVQYSYLPSWLSLLAESEYGAETAQAVFKRVYDYWRRLPEDERPRLYLHGLSLGAMNSQRAADIYDVIADPFDGALWSGPPFRSTMWRQITRMRQPDSPAWLPRFRDGSIVRFANQYGGLERPEASWGPLRIIYLQYASDPITFFEPEILYRRPEWLESPRGPDVSEELRWYPVVTMLQLAVDMGAGDNVPPGYGHVFAARDYIRAWAELLDPPDWDEAGLAGLRSHYEQLRGPAGRRSVSPEDVRAILPAPR